MSNPFIFSLFLHRMKSLISLSILSACFVACQPSKAPEQKQTPSATAIDTTMVDTSALASVLLEPGPPPPPPPAPKYLEFVAPTLDVSDRQEDEGLETTNFKTNLETQTIDISMLPVGIYQIRIENDNIIYCLKLIKV
jgi:hypothetical protein